MPKDQPSLREANAVPADPRVRLGPNYKWYVIAMLWFIAFFNYADRTAFSAVMPAISKELDLTLREQGIAVAAFAWLYGLGAPFAGFIVDRVARKRAILFGLHIWSLICMATALSRNFSTLFIFRAAEGIGETFYFPASMSLVADYHNKSTRSRAMSIHQTSVYVGTIVGSAISGYIADTQFGWRGSFIFFGGLGVLLGIVLHRFLHEPRRGTSEPEFPTPAPGAVSSVWISFKEFVALVRRTPSLLMLLGAFMCANFVATVLMGWMPSYLNKEFHMSLWKSALQATIYIQGASMIAAPMSGYLADRLRLRLPGGRMLMQMIGVFGGAPFVVLCGLTQSVTWLIVSLTFWGFFKGLYDANIFAAAYDFVRPDERGKTAGFLNAIGWLVGGVTGPIVVAEIASRTSLGFAIATTAAVYILAGLFLLLGATRFARRDTERMLAAQGT